MKKKKIVQQSRKVFSAVIAASVIASSAVPETILAADFDDVEISMEAENEELLGQTEELTAESESETADDELTVIEDDQTSVADVELPADDAEADLPDNETDVYSFADGEAVFSDGETVAISESAQELQNRINALPTVEEFKNMTGGETVEGSTLNQKQMDVYNEVQAIAEIYDGLTKEEQAQVDTEKLEALCGYFNAQTDTTLEMDYSKVGASNLQLYDNGNVKSVDVTLQDDVGRPIVNNLIGLVVLDKDIGKNLSSRYYSHWTTYEESLAKTAAEYDTKILFKTAGKTTWSSKEGKNLTATFIFDNGGISINEDKTYYLYLWSQSTYFFPESQVLQLEIKDGKVYYKTPADTDEFQRLKQDIEVTMTVDDWAYNATPSTPKLTIKAGNKDITSLYNPSDIVYTYYTNSGCTSKTNSKQGATTPGGVPNYVYPVEYHVKAEIPENDDYNGGTATASFNIVKADQAPPTVQYQDETIRGRGDGKITGLNSGMRYMKEGDRGWTTVKWDDFTLWAEPGTYFVIMGSTHDYNASEPTKVVIKEGRALQVNLPEEQTGYTLTASATEASWNDSVTLTFALKDGYFKNSNFAVKVNDKKVSLGYGGTYTIKNAQEDINVTVTGVTGIKDPTGSVSISGQTWKSFIDKDNVKFNRYYRDSREVSITADGEGSKVKDVSYYLSEEALSDSELRNLASSEWTRYEKTFSLPLKDGKVIVYVKITGEAGNEVYLSSDGIVIDTTTPSIIGVESDKTYTKITKFKVTDTNLWMVTIDGQEVTPDNDGNYILIPKNGTYTIVAEDWAGNKTEIKNVTVNWQEVKIPSVDSKVYTGEALTADIEDTEDYTVVKNEGGVNAGSYEVILRLKNAANYKWQGEEGGQMQTTVGFEITKAELIVDVTAPNAETDLTYDGQDHELIKAGTAEKGTLVYRVNNGKWTTEVPSAKDAGVYKISYKVTGDENHKDSAEKQLTVTIAPKEVTVTAADAKKNEGAKDPKLTYKAEGLVGKDTLANIVISRKKGEKAGTYAITVSQKQGANPNYKITFKNATFTIVQTNVSAKTLIKMKLPLLIAKGNGSTNSVQLKWDKVKGAEGYDVYGAACDGKQNFKKLATVKNGKTSIQHKKLKKNGEYKYFVAAYRMADGNKVYLAKSETLHVALKQSAKTNAKTVSVKKKSVTLRKGKTFQIKAGVRLANAKKKELQHEKAFRYYVVNSKVATVSANGKIKAKSKGTTTVYVIANNGACSKVKVTVK